MEGRGTGESPGKVVPTLANIRLSLKEVAADPERWRNVAKRRIGSGTGVVREIGRRRRRTESVSLRAVPPETIAGGVDRVENGHRLGIGEDRGLETEGTINDHVVPVEGEGQYPRDHSAEVVHRQMG